MREWKSIIGFSGTISVDAVSNIKAELKNPLCLFFETLRLTGLENRITSVISTTPERIYSEIAK